MNSPKRLLNKNHIELKFDLAAQSYDDFASVQREMADDLLQQFDRLNPATDAPIVDLGCGTGELLRKLKSRGQTKLTGVDLSQKMLIAATVGNEALNPVHADLESLPCHDQQFNFAFSNAAIQWCNPQVAAREIYRVLSPGGTALIGTFVPGTLGQWSDAFDSIGITQRVHSFCKPDSLQAVFAAAQFSNIEVSQSTRRRRFQSAKEMFRSIQQIGASNAMESRHQPITRDEYRKLMEHFESQLKQAGGLDLDYVCLTLTATRPDLT